ncbi:hypothetical protein E4U42_006379 [Claviceps africana]|uniref:TeaA receptor TeaR n=1 Tax=Claviceps africana TaxID=83212 RepID=A0A8K0J2G3_9HYPO|nr:hypothetical protein E4U42_006379 [Claviceps africana]
MAAVSSASMGATALASPSGSHGDPMWDYPSGASENPTSDNNGSFKRQHSLTSPLGSKNDNSVLLASREKASNHADMTEEKMLSAADHINAASWADTANENINLEYTSATGPKIGLATSSDEALPISDERKRHMQHTLGLEYSEEDSKWIHRDKLAKIESEELQAAGFVIPRVRSSSKQRRVRGQHSIDSTLSRPRNDAVTADRRDDESSAPAWDLRTAEEIAEEEAKAYFAAHGHRGGTRIPVARTSAAPIPQDFLERNSPSARRIDALDGDTIAYTKTRSRSASASTKDLEAAAASNRVSVAKRSVTDSSPKKIATRKTSVASRSSVTASRVKARPGFGKDASRSGESFAASYHPEGEPPWVFDSYKPDPRLPPDQQLLPTVAKRLRQEQWEKEGKFGNVYDKDFRPLNDHSFPRAGEREERVDQQENHGQAQTGDWPLKADAAKSPKQSSYSTMPKISDRPNVGPMAPMTSPKTPCQTPAPATATESHDAEPATQSEPKAETKDGCGCCAVM